MGTKIKGIHHAIKFNRSQAGAKAFQLAMQKNGNRCELITHEGGKYGYLMFDKQLYLNTLKQTEKFLATLGMGKEE